MEGHPMYVFSPPSPAHGSPAAQSKHPHSIIMYVAFIVSRHYLTPNIAEIDALLVKEREYVARIDELSTSLGAFRAAYTSSQEDVNRKSEEAARLLSELHALKVCLPPSLSCLLIPPPGARETCYLSLGRRWDHIHLRPHHPRPGRWPQGCQVADRKCAPPPGLRTRSREIPPLGPSILQQAWPSRHL